MQTIHSRTYTNVALTVLIILLLLVAIRPYVGSTRAYALDMESKSSTRDDSSKASFLNPNIDLTAAIREVAQSNHEIANAIRETGKAQQEVARSIARLSENAASIAK